jgi:hypothetical protein
VIPDPMTPKENLILVACLFGLMGWVALRLILSLT